jgi:hypothetical protein
MKKIATIGLMTLVGCATMHQRNIESQLETMAAHGQFSVIVDYVNNEINAHPEQYKAEMYKGASVALQHDPQVVYMLAAQYYEEQMLDDMQSLVYALQQMSENGFAYEKRFK